MFVQRKRNPIQTVREARFGACWGRKERAVHCVALLVFRPEVFPYALRTSTWKKTPPVRDPYLEAKSPCVAVQRSDMRKKILS